MIVQRTIEQLREASKHLHYEIELLDYTAKALAMAKHVQLRNALLESFTIHARALMQVFFSSGGESTDVLALHYFDDAMTWRKARGTEPRFDVRGNVGTQIAHLSYDRLDIGPDAKQWPVSSIHRDLMRVVYAFEAAVPRDRLADTWQDFTPSEVNLPALLSGNMVSTTEQEPVVSIPISCNTPAVNDAFKGFKPE
jgi:hypothetical protein